MLNVSLQLSTFNKLSRNWNFYSFQKPSLQENNIRIIELTGLFRNVAFLKQDLHNTPHTNLTRDKLLKILEGRKAHCTTSTERSTSRGNVLFQFYFTFNSTYYSQFKTLLNFYVLKHQDLQKLMQTVFKKLVNALLTGTHRYFHLYILMTGEL